MLRRSADALVVGVRALGEDAAFWQLPTAQRLIFVARYGEAIHLIAALAAAVRSSSDGRPSLTGNGRSSAWFRSLRGQRFLFILWKA